MNEKLVRLLGLSRKAGGCICGASAVEFSIKSGKCRLVMIADDAGGSTKDKFVHLCELNNIKHIILADKASLGKAVGYDEKAVIGIANENFAEGIYRQVSKE